MISSFRLHGWRCEGRPPRDAPPAALLQGSARLPCRGVPPDFGERRGYRPRHDPRGAESGHLTLCLTPQTPTSGKSLSLWPGRSSGWFGAGAARDTDGVCPPSGQARAGPSAQSPPACSGPPAPPRSPARRARHPPPHLQKLLTRPGQGGQKRPQSGWTAGPDRLGPPAR
jgi:hypothetical protein